MKLKIAVNKNCVNKSNPQKVATGWSNIFEDVDWLIGWVKAGFGWSATHFIDHHRLTENASGSNLIVVDFDGDTTLERFWATDTATNWCGATYTSASHTENEHRFRALFPLEIELKSTGQHRAAYWLVVNRLLVELGLDVLKDNCGQKPERLWYGNTNTVVQTNNGLVPEFLLADIDYEDNIEFIQADISQKDVDRCQWLLRNFIAPSEDGEYETRYVPVMAACAAIGEALFDDWVDWVMRGHHGSKDENIQAYKWRGLGNYSGPAKLYSLAKKQDPTWTNQLPVHLRFGAAGCAVGYTETDPVISFDDVISIAKGESMNIEPEPIPDASQVRRRGRPRRDNNDAAQEREQDVNTVKDIFAELRKNELTASLEYNDRLGKTVVLQGMDLDLMTTKLACENGVFIPEQRVKAAIQYAAALNSYCPIKSYLDKCVANAKPHADWDRIGEIYLGNNHPLATMTMKRMMIGAVARGYDPGCTMSWLPILVGAQGVGKSMFARNLVPEKLFSEITTPLETLTKEQYRLHVAWILELPEVDNYFNVKNIENFKNLITARVDETRYPYASLPTKLARRFVMIGTTNRNQFLVDSTGNRRFVPLEIGPGFQVPWKQLAQERDSLWAAAVIDYRNNEHYEFSSGEIAQISTYIQEFGDPDPWLDKICTFIALRIETTTAQILTEALDIDTRQQGRHESRRVADVLQTMGWRRQNTSKKDANGKRKGVRVWRRSPDDPLPEDHILNDF